MTATLTRPARTRAGRVDRITAATRPSAGAWTAQAQGTDRRRRAAATRIARTTGGSAPRWTGDISDADWALVLTAGAAALQELADTENGADVDGQLAAAAAEVARQAEELTAAAARNADRVLDRTRTGQARAAELLTRQEPGPAVEAFGEEETQMKKASPFRTKWAPGRTGPRWVCKSGRYGDGTPAPTAAQD